MSPRLRLVAATTRTSTVRRWLEPSTSKVRSCSTRSSFTCDAGSRSPISSRKIVPPLAISKRPLRSWRASVNAPRTWPNISLSNSDDEMPPRFTFTNGASAAPAVAVDGVGDQFLAGAAFAGDEHRRVGARSRGRSSAGCAAGAGPRPPGGRSRSWRRAPRATPRDRRPAAEAASPSTVRTVCRICSCVQGLVMKSVAPAFMPCTASWIDPQAVIRTTGTRRPQRLDARQQVQPFLAGRAAAEVHVLHHQLARVRVEPGQRLGRRRRRVAGVAGLLQQQRQRRGDRRVVVDDEDHGN